MLALLHLGHVLAIVRTCIVQIMELCVILNQRGLAIGPNVVTFNLTDLNHGLIVDKDPAPGCFNGSAIELVTLIVHTWFKPPRPHPIVFIVLNLFASTDSSITKQSINMFIPLRLVLIDHSPDLIGQ